MGAEQVRSTMNRELGRFLYSARKQSRQSVSQICASLGISESMLKSMEERPAEVPCRDLYGLFKHYGPEQMHQAQLVLIDAQATILSRQRGIRLGLDSWNWEFPGFRFPRLAGALVAVGAGRFFWDFLRGLFRGEFQG